jgi:hypothetical protein
MPCLNPDGTLTRFAQAVLASLAERPSCAMAIASAQTLPLYRIRATLRETAAAGLIESVSAPISHTDQALWRLTALGLEALELGRPDLE